MFRNRDDQNLVLVSSLADSVTDTSITKVFMVGCTLGARYLTPSEVLPPVKQWGGGRFSLGTTKPSYPMGILRDTSLWPNTSRSKTRSVEENIVTVQTPVWIAVHHRME